MRFNIYIFFLINYNFQGCNLTTKTVTHAMNIYIYIFPDQLSLPGTIGSAGTPKHFKHSVIFI